MTEAYIEGFAKMAEACGVDPQELMKYAQQTNAVPVTSAPAPSAAKPQRRRQITWDEVQRMQRSFPKDPSAQPLVPVSGAAEFKSNIVNQVRNAFRRFVR